MPPPARCCDRMLGVHAHAPHDPSRTSARGSCGRHRRSPLRPRSTHTPAMPSDATGGWPCLHLPCVSSRAHHPAHYSAHGHMQRRADVYMRNVAYAYSTSLTRSRSDTLVRTRAHAHAHSQTDRFTHTDGISQERHTQTHTCTHMHTRTHTQTHTCTNVRTNVRTRLPTYTHTDLNTHRHTKEHARTNTHTQTFLCMCDIHMHTHATPVLTHTCNTRTHTRLPTYTHTP